MVRYYTNDDNPNIVIRYTEPAKIHIIRRSDKKWYELPHDNSYLRELLIGQGNNCMTEISIYKAKKMIERWLADDLHTCNKESLKTMF